MMLKYFSVVVSGIGWILCTLGILFFVLTFHYRLHSFMEPTASRRSNSMVEFFSKAKFVFAIMVGILFASLFVIVSFRDFQHQIQIQVRALFLVATLFIVVFKYYIEQNHNLKLYLSVYHQIPAPVLPWQLPANFDPNFVKIDFIPCKNE